MLWFLIIGIIAGWLAGKIVKSGGFGVIGDLVVGVVGSFIGGYLSGIITATIGAIALLWIVRYFYSLMILYIYNAIESS